MSPCLSSCPSPSRSQQVQLYGSYPLDKPEWKRLWVFQPEKDNLNQWNTMSALGWRLPSHRCRRWCPCLRGRGCSRWSSLCSRGPVSGRLLGSHGSYWLCSLCETRPQNEAFERSQSTRLKDKRGNNITRVRRTQPKMDKTLTGRNESLGSLGEVVCPANWSPWAPNVLSESTMPGS